MYEFDSLQMIISVVYEALAVLAEVDHSQPVRHDVVHVHLLPLTPHSLMSGNLQSLSYTIAPYFLLSA